MTELRVQCCIMGGGPAGLMLGYLLGRAGVQVLVVEKHADFLRDFRGDTIHPSTLEVMHELGLLEEFLRIPHQQVQQLAFQVGDAELPMADFSRLPTHCKFVGFMPQWDFLNFLAEQARAYPSFDLRMRHQAKQLLRGAAGVTGVLVETPEGQLRVSADLIVAADGRHSLVRESGDLEVLDLGAPMDVLWLRISRAAADREQSFGRLAPGRILLLLNRGDYWQCAYVIGKGAFTALRARGIESFRSDVAELAPFLSGRVREIASWDDVKLLTVRVDRLRKWYQPGLLCIGDAAHAMSPLGGVGINLAIQDAVAAANILIPAFPHGVTEATLRKVQKRRELPTRVTQAAQLFMQNRIIDAVLSSNDADFRPPLPIRIVAGAKPLRHVVGYAIGIGLRPEHIDLNYRVLN